MPALVLVSPQSPAGKTTLSGGIAQKAKSQGKTFSLRRLEGDGHASDDARLFARFPGAAAEGDLSIIEAPAGDPPSSGLPADARILVVARADSDAGEVSAYCRALGERLAGVVLNRVPARREKALRYAYESAGLPLLACVPEDRVLAAPLLRDVAAVVGGETLHLEGNETMTLDRLLIASIAADPGQNYFDHYGANAVIVRSDKPDLQLAALNSGTSCMIITGGLPLLSYVLERAESDETPLVRTELDTIETVKRIEDLYGETPFAGETKLRRLAELLADVSLPA